ncbi:MAG: hypothetical protein AVDCRST_MAG31-2280, partial [uncultured Sphingomonas sp.]
WNKHTSTRSPPSMLPFSHRSMPKSGAPTPTMWFSIGSRRKSSVSRTRCWVWST